MTFPFEACACGHIRATHVVGTGACTACGPAICPVFRAPEYVVSTSTNNTITIGLKVVDTTIRIPLDKLHVKPNIPAGMDAGVALGMVKLLRTTSEDWDPILVRRNGNHWMILDGRHRFIASLIAGRADILAIEE